MAGKLKPDVLAALADWKAGKAVKCVELGHAHRMIERPPFGFTIDENNHLQNDQERALGYCFQIVEFFNEHGLPEGEEAHARFLAICDSLHGMDADLTREEKDGAQSLAWKALRVGWGRALAGHSDAHYVEVTNPAAKTEQAAAQ